MTKVAIDFQRLEEIIAKLNTSYENMESTLDVQFDNRTTVRGNSRAHESLEAVGSIINIFKTSLKKDIEKIQSVSKSYHTLDTSQLIFPSHSKPQAVNPLIQVYPNGRPTVTMGQTFPSGGVKPTPIWNNSIEQLVININVKPNTSWLGQTYPSGGIIPLVIERPFVQQPFLTPEVGLKPFFVSNWVSPWNNPYMR